MKHKLSLLNIFAVVLVVILGGCKTSTEPTTPLTVKQGITGTVTSSSNGSPISGVTVALSAPAANQTTTNGQGAYKFDNVPVGQYTVSFSNPSYAPQSQSVHVDSGSNSVLNISLSPISSTANLSFHIRDAKSGLPIVGAKINDRSVSDSMITDAGGNAFFAFNSSSSNQDYVEFSAVGYISQTHSVGPMKFGSTLYDTISMIRYEDFLVCAYRFASNFLDSSGKGHDATQHGGKFVTDRFGNASGALQLNGTTDYVSVPDAADLNFGKSTDFTICVWANYPMPQPNSEEYLVSKSTTITNVFTGYEVSLIVGGLNTGAKAGTTYGEVAAQAYQLGGDSRWHFLCCVFSRTGTITTYQDGKKVNTQDDPNGYLAGNINTTAQLLIGGTGSSKNAYKGMIDDIKIYGMALDDSAVNEVYHENGW